MAPCPHSSTGWSPGRELAGGWAGCSSALCASVSPAVPQFPLTFQPCGCRQDHHGQFHQSLPSPTAHPAHWEHGDSSASQPALPGAPAQLPGAGTGQRALAVPMASIPLYCPSLLQAPASSGTHLCLKSQVKALLNSLCDIPSPASTPPQHRAPQTSESPSGSSAQPCCSHKPAGCRVVGMLSPPQFFLGGSPHSQPAIPIHLRSEDPSAGSRQVGAGSCLPCQPRQAPRGLIPACKY